MLRQHLSVEEVPQCAMAVPQYTEEVHHYAKKVPHYTEEMPQWLSRASGSRRELFQTIFRAVDHITLLYIN